MFGILPIMCLGGIALIIWRLQAFQYTFGHLFSGWSFQSVFYQFANLISSLTEQCGFIYPNQENWHVSKFPVFGRYQDEFACIPLLFAVFGLVMVFLSRDNSFILFDFSTNEWERLRLLRIWCMCVSIVQMLSGILFVGNWKLGLNSWNNYRYVMAAAPVFQLLLAIGVLQTGIIAYRYVARQIVPTIFIVMIAIGHICVLVPVYRDFPWRFSNMPAKHPFESVLVSFLKKWDVDWEWLTSSAYIDSETVKRPYELVYPFLTQQLVDHHSEAGRNPLSPAHVIFFTRAGSALERNLLETCKILDEFDTGSQKGYLCIRSARQFLEGYPFVPLFQDYSYWCPAESLNRNITLEGKRFVLIACNSRPSAEIHAEIYFDVLIEQVGHDLAVRCMMRLDGVFFAQDNDLLVGPHVEIVGSRKEQVVRIDLPFNFLANQKQASEIFQAGCVLEGWSPEDITDVLCGIDSYLDPSHYLIPKKCMWSVFDKKGEDRILVVEDVLHDSI